MGSQGYVQKRRGILEHIEDGRMTAMEYASYDVMILKADKSTGIWRGSAKALSASFGAGDISTRQARKLLESLEEKRYIRRFCKRGFRHNYPILINRFLVSFGANSGKVLNAVDTNDYKNPVYESGQVEGQVKGQVEGQVKGEVGASIRDLRPETSRPEDQKITRVREKHSNSGRFHFSGTKLRITDEEHATFSSAFQGTDLDSQYLRMDAWLVSNRRNYRSFGRFANAWLSRLRIPETGGFTRGETESKHIDRQRRVLEERRRALSGGGGFDDEDFSLLATGGKPH